MCCRRFLDLPLLSRLRLENSRLAVIVVVNPAIIMTVMIRISVVLPRIVLCYSALVAARMTLLRHGVFQSRRIIPVALAQAEDRHTVKNLILSVFEVALRGSVGHRSMVCGCTPSTVIGSSSETSRMLLLSAVQEVHTVCFRRRYNLRKG